MASMGSGRDLCEGFEGEPAVRALRVEREGVIEGRLRFGDLPLCGVEDAEVIIEARQIGVEAERAFEGFLAVDEVAREDERVPERVGGEGAGGIETGGHERGGYGQRAEDVFW